MYKLKKINVLSLAYMVALINFIFGILIAISSLAIRSNQQMASVINPNLLSLTPLQILLIYPFSNLIGGFLMALVIGFLYNIFAPKIGGIAFDLLQVVPAKKAEPEPKSAEKEKEIKKITKEKKK